MLTCDLELDELTRMARSVESDIHDAIPRIVTAAAKEGAAEAVRVHPYTDRTGNLTASIQGELVMATRGQAEAEIVADEPYARFVEGGTKPHGNHPGSKPYPFMGPAYLKAERVIEAQIAQLESDLSED